MRWQLNRRFLWLIALSAILWGFTQFGLPMFYETRRQNSYRQIFLSSSLKVCKDIRVSNLTTHNIPIIKGGDLAADKIDVFCNCRTDGDANSLSKDEWQYLSVHNDLLPSTEAKREVIFQNVWPMPDNRQNQ